MEEKIYETCLKEKKKSNGKPFWGTLAKKLGFPKKEAPSAEALRSSFRREQRRRKDYGVDLEKEEHELPRICIFDIENAPMKVYTFGLYDQNIAPVQIINDTFLLCWSAKYLNDPQQLGDVLTPEEAVLNNDERIVRSAWELLNSCDILIGQNIRDFDLKKINTRFIYYGLPPLSQLQIIDTLLIARSSFGFSSNKLAYINKFLGIQEKIENEGFGLWVRCCNGEQEALNEMFTYCHGDVGATEELYFKIRPFIKGHPNLALFHDSTEVRCPNCASTSLSDNGKYFTPAGKYASMRCDECGAVVRVKQNEIGKDKRKALLVN